MSSISTLSIRVSLIARRAIYSIVFLETRLDCFKRSRISEYVLLYAILNVGDLFLGHECSDYFQNTHEQIHVLTLQGLLLTLVTENAEPTCGNIDTATDYKLFLILCVHGVVLTTSISIGDLGPYVKGETDQIWGSGKSCFLENAEWSHLLSV